MSKKKHVMLKLSLFQHWMLFC